MGNKKSKNKGGYSDNSDVEAIFQKIGKLDTSAITNSPNTAKKLFGNSNKIKIKKSKIHHYLDHEDNTLKLNSLSNKLISSIISIANIKQQSQLCLSKNLTDITYKEKKLNNIVPLNFKDKNDYFNLINISHFTKIQYNQLYPKIREFEQLLELKLPQGNEILGNFSASILKSCLKNNLNHFYKQDSKIIKDDYYYLKLLQNYLTYEDFDVTNIQPIDFLSASIKDNKNNFLDNLPEKEFESISSSSIYIKKKDKAVVSKIKSKNDRKVSPKPNKVANVFKEETLQYSAVNDNYDELTLQALKSNPKLKSKSISKSKEKIEKIEKDDKKVEVPLIKKSEKNVKNSKENDKGSIISIYIDLREILKEN